MYEMRANYSDSHNSANHSQGGELSKENRKLKHGNCVRLYLLVGLTAELYEITISEFLLKKPSLRLRFQLIFCVNYLFYTL